LPVAFPFRYFVLLLVDDVKKCESEAWRMAAWSLMGFLFQIY